MSKLRILLFLLLLQFLYAENNVTKVSKELKYIQTVYENALRDFRYGSYYEALDEFGYVSKFPKTKYYLPSLFMLANTYLYIGKRTGEKKYFWSARNYLNLYLAKGGKKDASYYYLKGNIFENLGFYERALSNYKIALSKAKDKKEKLKIVMGLLRSAVWLKRVDLATRYMLILSIESLGKQQQKEFEFLQGMYYFAKKDYKKALKYFKKTYKTYESYLIDNPQYYYLVAETAYRLGDLRFAERLFRRIIFYIKNKDVLQKTLLRLGDIKFLEKEYKESASAYIRLIKTYPDSSYALVAKLKLLYLIHSDKKIQYYIKKYMPDADFLKDPQKFIVETLVKNRTNYIGLFALANLGMLTFDLDSAALFKRLTWEISLVSPQRLKFEHMEYFKRLWRPFLMDKSKKKRLCSLYLANPEFFLRVFDQKVLLHIADALKRCDKNQHRVKLLEELAQKYNDDMIRLQLAKALYESKKYELSMKILKQIGQKNCEYYKLYSAICFLKDKECEDIYKKVPQVCGSKELYSHIFANLASKSSVQAGFLRRYKDVLAKKYQKDEVVRKFVQLFAKRLIEKRRYKEVVDLLGPLAKEIEQDCFLNGVLSLSYVRLGKMKYARKLLEKSRNCNDNWYLLAKNALEDALLKQKLKGL